MRRTNEGLAGNVFMSTVDAVNPGAVKQFLLDLQARICERLAAEEDEARFVTDRWDRGGGGGGVSRVLSEGAVFEKAGVNFSHVFGDSLPPSATATRPELAGRALSGHGGIAGDPPRNPFVPTSHANFRLFATTGDDPAWWFGGGYDLTPYYGFDEDCIHWHRTATGSLRALWSGVLSTLQGQLRCVFPPQAPGECRGIGGLFFDDFNEGGFDHSFAFVRSLARSYLDAYMPIVERRKHLPWTGEQRRFQEYRRGRYVEFNLVYDRARSSGCSPASAESSRF